MNYKTFTPPEALRPFVKYFWALQGDTAIDTAITFSAIPDGCPGVIMFHSDKDALLMDEDKRMPNIFLYGQTIAPALFSAKGQFGAVGICFQPHAIKSIFGMDANELTSSCVDLSLVGIKKRTNLPQQLADAASVDEQIKMLSMYLFDQYQSNTKHPDEATKYAIQQLTQSKGSISLKELQQQVNITERALERKFKDSVGISPRLFSRIVRFQETMDQLRRNDFDKLSDIAYQNDYTDQSHFIKVFKEFTGFSPLDFQKQSNEVVENFPQIIK